MPSHANTSAEDLCDRAVALTELGELEDAESVAAAVGAPCPGRVAELTARAREVSDALATKAQRTQDEGARQRLAELALDLDAGNAVAQELLGADEIDPDPSLCADADAAVQGGRFARAEALYAALDGVEGAEECRQSGLVALADARSDAWPQRILDTVTQDALALLLLMAVAGGLGVATGLWWRPRWAMPALRIVLIVALVVLFAASTFMGARWPAAAAGAGTALSAGLHLVVLLLAYATGLVSSAVGGQRAPLRIEVSPQADGEELVEDVARHTVTQLHQLASGQAEGIYALKGTDLHDTGIRGVLGSLGHPWLDTLLKVWDAIVLRSGDRVLLSRDGEDMVVSMYTGRRLAAVRTVSAREFQVDPQNPTERERSTRARDTATEVAAHLLWWRLADPPAEPRLYGATSARGLALSAVAAARLDDRDLVAAGRLAARGVHRDPNNRAAVLAQASADLIGSPNEALEDLRIRQLQKVLDCENKHGDEGSPLSWRVRYTLGVAVVNRRIARSPHLDEEGWRADFQQALAHWAFFLPREERERLPMGAPEHTVGARPKPHPDDQRLWDYLERAARSATASIIVALRTRAGMEPVTTELDDWPLLASRTDHLNVACGYAVAYLLAPEDRHHCRRILATRCVERLRLAAPEPGQRDALLRDPFLRCITESGEESYRQLLVDWGLADGPYAEIASFGSCAPALARRFPTPDALSDALATSLGRETLLVDLAVDVEALRWWRGAAQWLAAGAAASLVDCYQRAGFVDQADVRRHSDAAVVRRLAAASVVHEMELPSSGERAIMRGVGSHG